MKNRIQIKHDTEENWKKAKNFIPLAGELILYDGVMDQKTNTYSTLPRFKIGDGIHNVNDLPFMSNEKGETNTVKDGVLKMN